MIILVILTAFYIMPHSEMDEEQKQQFERTMQLTRVIKAPTQKVFTFWDTEFNYFIISGNYSANSLEKSVLRSGQMQCRKPAIITPESMHDFFSGFDDSSRRFAEQLYANQFEKLRMLGYQFKNTLKKEEKLESGQRELIARLLKQNEDDKQMTVLSAPNDIWGLALTKAAIEIVTQSVASNVQDLQERGHFKNDSEKMRDEIDLLFEEAKKDSSRIDVLAKTLQQYNLYEEYEDNFYQLIRARK